MSYTHLSEEHDSSSVSYPQLNDESIILQEVAPEYVPVTTMYSEPLEVTNQILEHRRVEFSCTKYFSEAFNFMKHNPSNICGAICLWSSLLIVYGFALFLFVFAIFGIIATNTNNNNSSSSDFMYMDYDNSVFDYYTIVNTMSIVLPGVSVDSIQYHVNEYSSFVVTQFPNSFDSYSYTSSDIGSTFSGSTDSTAWVIIACISVSIGVLTLFLIIPQLIGGTFGAVFKAIRTNSIFMVSDIISSAKQVYCRTFLLFLLTLVIEIPFIIIMAFSPITSILLTNLGRYFIMFSVPLLVDHPLMSVYQTIIASAKITVRYHYKLFGFVLLLVIMQIPAIFTYGFTLIFTLPFAFISFCFCYAHIVGIQGATVYVPANAPCLIPENNRHPMLDAL